MRRLLLCLLMVLGCGSVCVAQMPPITGVSPEMMTSLDDIINFDPPLVPSTTDEFITPPMFTYMRYAIQHDARWYLSAGTHIAGMTSSKTSLFTGGAEVLENIGHSFQTILRYYNEYQRAMELYAQMNAMWKFIENYKVKINPFRFVPNLVVKEGGDPFSPTARTFVVGFVPKHDRNWSSNAAMFGDNPYYQPTGPGMKLVEIRYPRSLADLKIDPSIWGSDDLEEEEFQKRLLAGLYDGVVSAARFLGEVGVDNNVELSMGRMSPKNLAARVGLVIDKRIAALKRQRAGIEAALSSPGSPAAAGYSTWTPEALIAEEQKIDNEVARLETEKSKALGVQIASQQPWVERAGFIHAVLSKLEANERRLTIARMAERYKRFESAWSNPNFMNTKPDITGDARVDDAIYLIWEAITLISGGKVPPPNPVSGGEAAKAQAVVVKAAYRTLTYEELSAIRQLLTSEFQYRRQKDGAKIIQDAQDEIHLHMKLLERHAERLDMWRKYNDRREDFLAKNPDANWALGFFK